MVSISTIGYEGFTVDAWVSELKKEGVNLIIDVRELPLSRRKGFSRTALSERLVSEGIEYRHARDLGNPKDLRHGLKDGGLCFDDFRAVFLRILEEREDALRVVLGLAADHAVCLMCFEEDPSTCHRSIVAERIAELAPGEAEVRHVRRSDQNHAHARRRQDVSKSKPEVRRSRVHGWDRYGEPKVRPASPC